MPVERASPRKLTDEQLDQIVLTEFPYPIAANYRRLLDATDWERRTRICIEVFEFGMRAITLGLLSQYLIRDADEVGDPILDEMLRSSIDRATLGQWTDFFFNCLRAYQGQRELFFMEELYDLYWNTSRKPHARRRKTRGPFDKLVEIRNDIAHHLPPDTEAGWEQVGREAIRNLRAVMSRFSFLQDYDLIRIVGRQDNEHWYDRYTGQEITSHCELLRGRKELQQGWFYLSREDRSVLQLHPLFVFWRDEDEPGATKEEYQDAAVYDRWLKGSVAFYIATVVRESVERRDAELLHQFQEMLLDSLEHRKPAPERVALSWEGLRQAVAALTAQQMETVATKYQQPWYLQREETFRSFQQFLASDKGCFVLTGKSGVGKSSFILSFADEFADRDDVCLLMYNAARSPVPDSMVEAVSYDLVRFLETEGEAPSVILTELEQRSFMTDKTLIIVFDAINENVNGKELLGQIDAMVHDVRYSWLKVVITSRPQAWRNLRKGHALSVERYYRDPGKDEHWVELGEFTTEQAVTVRQDLTVKLEEFPLEELPKVYEKYRKAFQIQSDYDSLPAPIRSALRDPLVLRLVAEICQGRAIPEKMQVDDIYEQYVQTLVLTDRLYEEDLILLEQELMPLMLDKELYANVATAWRMDAAQTQDNRQLWDLVFNRDLLSSGQRVNASYERLRDTEILVELGSDQDRAIGFEYERFYEFFGGRRLRKLRQDVPDLYEEVGDALPDHVFLWGALVQALTSELLANETDRVTCLMSRAEENPLLRSALVAALTAYGQEQPSAAGQLVTELVGDLTPPPRNILQAVWRLVRPVKNASRALLMEQRIAIEVAANLKMQELLVRAATDASQSVRGIAGQSIFYLWREDQTAGIMTLDALSQQVTNEFGLPDLGVVESVLGIVGAILGHEHKDPETLTDLLALGRRSLRQILYLSDENTGSGLYRRARRVFLVFVYRLVVGTILRFVIRVMKNWAAHAWASFDSLAHVFELSESQKDLLRDFIPLLEPGAPGLADRLPDMIIIQEWGDAIAQALVEIGILAHGVHDFDATLPVVEELTEIGLQTTPPRFWVGGPIWNLWQSSMRVESPDPAFLELVKRTTMAVQENPKAWAERSRAERPVPITSETEVGFLVAYIGAHYGYTGESPPPLVVEWLEQAMQAGNEEYLRLYVYNELTVLFECGLSYPAVMALKPIAGCTLTKVREPIIDFLVRVRQNDPDLVEDVFLQGDFPPEIVSAVQATPTSERLIDMVTYQLAILLYDLFILGPEPLRLETQWFFAQALTLSSLPAWISLVIKEIGNLLVGEQVFSVPKDAPSRLINQTAEIADLLDMGG